jgi:molybdopterin-guanine dinucleotide biosynthesis protein A
VSADEAHRPRSVTGAIVAGGASERFGGEPKGLLTVGGVRIIDRVASAIRAVTTDIVLVANSRDAERWLPGVPVHRDTRRERGSVVGVHTAIEAVRTGSVALVVAWDMPFVSAGLLELLAGLVRKGAPAAFPEGPGGPEPFCAAYTAACLPDIDGAIVRGDFRMSGVVARLPNTARVGLNEVRRFGDPGRLFFNVNTAADLETAERMAADG